MNENNLLYSAETSERKVDSVYIQENNNHNKTELEIEKEQYYILQENKELRENQNKLSFMLEELKNKLKIKEIDVLIKYYEF